MSAQGDRREHRGARWQNPRRLAVSVLLVAVAFLVGACGPGAKHKLEAVAAPDAPVVESLEGRWRLAPDRRASEP